MGKKKCSGTAHILVVTGGGSAGCNSSSTCSSSVFLFMSAWKQILNAENITKKKQQQQRSIMTLPLLWYLSGTEGSGLHTNDNCLSSLDAVFILGSQGFFMQTLPGHRRAAEGSCPWLTVRKTKSRRNLSYLVTAWVKRAHRATSSSLKWSSASVNLPQWTCTLLARVLERRGNVCCAFALSSVTVLEHPNLGVPWQGCAVPAVSLGRDQSDSCGAVSWWGSWAVDGICSLAANGWGQLWDRGRKKLSGLKRGPLVREQKGRTVLSMEHPNAGGIALGFWPEISMSCRMLDGIWGSCGCWHSEPGFELRCLVPAQGLDAISSLLSWSGILGWVQLHGAVEGRLLDVPPLFLLLKLRNLKQTFWKHEMH